MEFRLINSIIVWRISKVCLALDVSAQSQHGSIDVLIGMVGGGFAGQKEEAIQEFSPYERADHGEYTSCDTSCLTLAS